MFRVPAGRGAPTFTVVDTAGYERVVTSALPVALFVTRKLLLTEGQAWVRSSDATCAHVQPDHVDSDDPAAGWVRTLATALEDDT